MIRDTEINARSYITCSLRLERGEFDVDEDEDDDEEFDEVVCGCCEAIDGGGGGGGVFDPRLEAAATAATAATLE